MSKKFNGKLCVYCAKGRGEGADHVFAREFFLVQHRGGLPKVPACSKCNGDKAELEHYALSVLPFGGRHASARLNLETMIPKRLKRNPPLHRTLDQGRGRAWVKDRARLILPTMTIPIDGHRLERLFALIAKGLVWYHWQTYLSDADSINVTMLTKAGERFFEERFFQLNARDRVAVSLGDGTV